MRVLILMVPAITRGRTRRKWLKAVVRFTRQAASGARQAVFGRMGFAVLHFGIEYQTHVGDPVGVNGMTRPPRLGRVVANLRAILMAIEQFDRGIAIKYPVGGQSVMRTLGQRLVHLGAALGQLGLAADAFLFRAALAHRRRQVAPGTGAGFRR